MEKGIALIAGEADQHGAYLAELRLDRGDDGHGVKRRSSSFDTGRVDRLYANPLIEKMPFWLRNGDPTDATDLIRPCATFVP